jgi:excisionase family DNA binding protein
MHAPRPTVAPNDDRYMSLRELAKYAGISVRTLRKYVARSHNPLPHYRMGGGQESMILVKQSEFDHWMQQFHVEDDVKTVAVMADQLMQGMR